MCSDLQIITFPCDFFYSMEQSPSLQIRKFLSWSSNPRNFLNSTRRYMNSSQHPILSNLIQATLAQSNQLKYYGQKTGP